MTREEQEKKHAEFLAAAERAEWKPKDITQRATVAEIFGRQAPLEVDFGSGDGSFILAMAARFPERNFLGTERMLGRVEKRAVARRDEVFQMSVCCAWKASTRRSGSCPWSRRPLSTSDSRPMAETPPSPEAAFSG